MREINNEDKSLGHGECKPSPAPPYTYASERMHALGYGHSVFDEQAKDALREPHKKGADSTIVAAREKAHDLLAAGKVEEAKKTLREALQNRLLAGQTIADLNRRLDEDVYPYTGSI